MNFNSFNHFRSYMCGVFRNKEVINNEGYIESLDNFEKVHEFLVEAWREDIIGFESIVFNYVGEIAKKCKTVDDVDHLIYRMDYIYRKCKKVKSNTENFYYLVTALRSVFGMDIEFNPQFITKENLGHKWFPKRVPIVELFKEDLSVYGVSVDEISEDDFFGIYFLYDSEGKLAYIGKSASGVINRSMGSIKERNLFDFSKIEYRKTNTKSDASIYEAYYISKLSPYLNSEFMHEDEPTITLPELRIEKTITRNRMISETIPFKYYKQRVCDTLEFVNAPSPIGYIELKSIYDFLEEKGFLSKHDAYQKAYREGAERLKQKGLDDLKNISFGLSN